MLLLRWRKTGPDDHLKHLTVICTMFSATSMELQIEKSRQGVTGDASVGTMRSLPRTRTVVDADVDADYPA